ncbi:MAG: ligand-binding sensor domain-containing protein, partial [Chitinophagaceae bacterium]
VNAICQDMDGFLWFATNEGLDRYDGKHFLIYRHQQGDFTSIASSIIWGVVGDQRGNIWVATGSGISCLHSQTGKFDNYYVFSGKQRQIKRFNKIVILTSGEILGLVYFPEVSEPELYRVNLSDHRLYRLTLPFTHTVSNNREIRSIVVLNNGWIMYQSGNNFYLSMDGAKHAVWLNSRQSFPSDTRPDNLFLIYADSSTCWLSNGIKGNKSQLLVYYYKKNQWQEFTVPYHIIISQGDVYGNQHYWFSGYTSGLLRINTHTGKCFRFLHNENDPSSISDNTIYGSYVDHQGTLWLATEGGVDYWNEKEDYFHFINNKINGFENFGGLSWGSMAEDSSGKLWMGTVDYNFHNNALFSLDPVTMKFQRYNCPKNISNGDMPVWNILPVDRSKLLLSTQSGLYEFNTNNKKFSRPQGLFLPREITRFRTGFTIMKKDQQGNLWFGLWKKGLIQYDLYQHVMVHFNTGSHLYSQRLKDDNVNDAVEDSHHLLWLIYRNSHLLTCIDILKHKIIKEYNLDYDGQNSLNGFSCICWGPSGKLWIGSAGEGLICFDPQNGKIKVYTFSDGLMSDVIYS